MALKSLMEKKTMKKIKLSKRAKELGVNNLMADGVYSVEEARKAEKAFLDDLEKSDES